jgi:hypothetical protein
VWNIHLCYEKRKELSWAPWQRPTLSCPLSPRLLNPTVYGTLPFAYLIRISNSTSYFPLKKAILSLRKWQCSPFSNSAKAQGSPPWVFSFFTPHLNCQEYTMYTVNSTTPHLFSNLGSGSIISHLSHCGCLTSDFPVVALAPFSTVNKQKPVCTLGESTQVTPMPILHWLSISFLEMLTRPYTPCASPHGWPQLIFTSPSTPSPLATLVSLLLLLPCLAFSPLLGDQPSCCIQGMRGFLGLRTLNAKTQ